MKTTALSLPSAVQPKPTRTEIVEAMVQRAKSRTESENEARAKKRESLLPKIEAAAKKAMKNFSVSVNIYTYSKTDMRKNHCDARVSNITSPEMEKLLDEYHKVGHLIRFDEKETRATIRRGLSGAHNPDPARLLANPSAVEAIDKTLEAWGI